MNLLRDWIAPLLDRSQRAYHDARPKQSVSTASGIFTFHNDLSNLRISLNVPFAENAQLVELRWTNGDLRGILTDAHVLIRTVIPRKAVSDWKNFCKNSAVAELRRGAFIRAKEVEFRVSDCFDPPRTELYVYALEVLSPDLAPQLRTTLVHADGEISTQNDRMATFAVLTADTDESIEQASPRSQASPIPCKSFQEQGQDSDIENEGDSFSQMDFATQMYSAPQAKQKRRPLQAIEATQQGFAPPPGSATSTVGLETLRAAQTTAEAHERQLLLPSPNLDNAFSGNDSHPPLPSASIHLNIHTTVRNGSLKRSVEGENLSDSRCSKKFRLNDPERPLLSLADTSEMSLNEVPKGTMRNRTKYLNSIMTGQTVRACYGALVMANEDIIKARVYLEQSSTQRPTNDRCIDADTEPWVEKRSRVWDSVGFVDNGKMRPGAAEHARAEKHDERPDRGRAPSYTDEAADPLPGATNSDLDSRFSRWRVSLANVCHLPRHHTKISKEQTALLEADHSWQPPLVGQISCPGSVPLDLLNKLTEAADKRQTVHTIIVSLDDDSDEEGEGKLPPASRRSARNCHVRAHSMDGDSSPERDNSVEWSASPQERDRKRNTASPLPGVEPEFWSSPLTASSPSPTHSRAQLPPDSPPPQRILDPCQSPNTRHALPVSAEPFSISLRSPIPNQTDLGEAVPHEFLTRDVNAEDEHLRNEVELTGRQCESNHETLQYRYREPSDEGCSRMDDETESPQRLEFHKLRDAEDAESLLHRLLQSTHDKESNGTQESAASRVGANPSSAEQSVQVKRTPYLRKGPPTACDEQPTGAKSPACSQMYVPGTFDDSVKVFDPMKEPKSHEENALLNRFTIDEEVFEPNSSEDDTALVPDIRQSKAKEIDTKLTKIAGYPTGRSCDSHLSNVRQSKSTTENLDPNLEPQISLVVAPEEGVNDTDSYHGTRYPVYNLRRMRNEEEGNFLAAAFKRPKTSAYTDPEPYQASDPIVHHFRIPDPDLLPVQDRIHRERQEFYASLKNRPTGANSPSTSKNLDNSRRTTVNTSSGDVINSATSSASFNPNPMSTPLTAISIHRKSSEGSQRQTSTQPALESLQEVVEGIFASFQGAYPGYHSDALQFQRSCQLISDLKRENRAPHPSLWDDFIIRHCHDYRGYVEEAQTRCQSILPFVTYYEDVVDDAQILNSVVGPKLINAFSSRPSSSARASSLGLRPTLSTTLQFEGLGSVDGGSSISNIEPCATSRNKTALPDLPLDMLQAHDEMPPSQQSSVKLWLEKAAGTESPVLGTPDSMRETACITTLNLDDVGPETNSSLPARASALKYKALASKTPSTPFQSPAAVAETRARPAPKALPLVSTGSAREDDLVHSQPGPTSHTDSVLLGAFPAPSSKVPGQPPNAGCVTRANGDKQSGPTLKYERVSEEIGVTNTSSPPRRSEENKKTESVIQRFARNYAELPGEKAQSAASTNSDVQRLISFFN